jgi:hypothetical protein
MSSQDIMSTKKASNSPGLCPVKGEKMTLTHMDMKSRTVPMKLVVNILIILKVKWDKPIQQLEKSNTSR